MVSEKGLPELQCGFRKERGCCDMISVACQLLEKARGHQDSLLTLFVDHRKAYVSVPRKTLWQVLERCGVPPRMLKVVKSFHERMQAVVRVGASVSDSFEVSNGLRQGCTLCSNTFQSLLRCSGGKLARGLCRGWSRCSVRPGRKLIADRTAKLRLSVA